MERRRAKVTTQRKVRQKTSKDVAPREYHGPTKRINKGLLVVYTGNGKGKTTAGMGAVFRSLGRGYKVAVVQFIKGAWQSGEIVALKKFGAQVAFHSVGEGFTWNTKSLDRDKKTAERGWALCLDLIKKGKHDVYLIDEILYVLKYKFLSIKTVVDGLSYRKLTAHVILTGRDAPDKIIKMADLVTEMKEIKHPFSKGILAQPGIDY